MSTILPNGNLHKYNYDHQPNDESDVPPRAIKAKGLPIALAIFFNKGCFTITHRSL